MFARRPIAAGTRVWQYDETMHVCDARRWRALDPRQLRYALHGGYLHKPSDRFLWYTDGMQFMNHAAGAAGEYRPRRPGRRCATTTPSRSATSPPARSSSRTTPSGRTAGSPPDHWLYPLYLEHCPEHYAFLLSLERVRVAA